LACPGIRLLIALKMPPPGEIDCSRGATIWFFTSKILECLRDGRLTGELGLAV
jgi:hypothetical protein